MGSRWAGFSKGAFRAAGSSGASGGASRRMVGTGGACGSFEGLLTLSWRVRGSARRVAQAHLHPQGTSRDRVRQGPSSAAARRWVGNPPLEQPKVRLRGLRLGVTCDPQGFVACYRQSLDAPPAPARTGIAMAAIALRRARRVMPALRPSPGTGEGLRSQAQGEGAAASDACRHGPGKNVRREMESATRAPPVRRRSAPAAPAAERGRSARGPWRAAARCRRRSSRPGAGSC